MLEKIKKMQGINHNDFNENILMWINAAKLDLKNIGIADTKINNPDSLLQTAIITYALSFLDVSNAEMYSNSYFMQKNYLRHSSKYLVESE